MNAVVELWPQGKPLDIQDKSTPTDMTFYPAASKGCMIILPGGAYGMCSSREQEPVATPFSQKGIASFSVRYRFAPHEYPVPLLDARRAVRHVRENAAEYGIDPEKIAILGFSAGGHLAALTGLIEDEDEKLAKAENELGLNPKGTSSHVNAMVLAYPVLSFLEFAHEGSVRNLLGADATPENRAKYSMQLRVTEKTPPTFLWHTADDGSVPVENSLMMATALRACKVPFELHVYPHGVHGLNVGVEPPVTGWVDACADWLKRMGW